MEYSESEVIELLETSIKKIQKANYLLNKINVSLKNLTDEKTISKKIAEAIKDGKDYVILN